MNASLEIDPDYLPGWLNLAIALQRRGADEEAQVAYRRAMELETSSRPVAEERGFRLGDDEADLALEARS